MDKPDKTPDQILKDIEVRLAKVIAMAQLEWDPYQNSWVPKATSDIINDLNGLLQEELTIQQICEAHVLLTEARAVLRKFTKRN